MGFAPGAGRRAGAVALVGLAAAVVSAPAGVGLLVVSGLVLWFYRDPDRSVPAAGIVAPADGKVTVLEAAGDRLRLGTFMNVTDVHVNRAPVGGTVRAVERSPGAHRPAFTKDSDRNERVRIVLDDVEVVLIAGAFARRITPYVDVDDAVERGDRIGHIAFGSRVDVVLPAGVGEADLAVGIGDRVRAGETVLAATPDGSTP